MFVFKPYSPANVLLRKPSMRLSLGIRHRDWQPCVSTLWPCLESHILDPKPISVAPAGLSMQKEFCVSRVNAAERGKGLKQGERQENSCSAFQFPLCNSHPLDVIVLKENIPPQPWLHLFGAQLPFSNSWIFPAWLQHVNGKGSHTTCDWWDRKSVV